MISSRTTLYWLQHQYFAYLHQNYITQLLFNVNSQVADTIGPTPPPHHPSRVLRWWYCHGNSRSVPERGLVGAMEVVRVSKTSATRSYRYRSTSGTMRRTMRRRRIGLASPGEIESALDDDDDDGDDDGI